MDKSAAYTDNYWEGGRYQESKRLSTVEIAKLVRKDVNELLKQKYPGVKVSIRHKYFAGGASITAEVKSIPFNPYTEEYLKGNTIPLHGKIYNEKGRDLMHDIKKAIDNYNYSDCDGMIDYSHVNYYSRVCIDWELEKELLKCA